jgi:hypothetical protein
LVASPRNQRYLRPRSEWTGAFFFAERKNARQRPDELDHQRAVLRDQPHLSRRFYLAVDFLGLPCGNPPLFELGGFSLWQARGKF